MQKILRKRIIRDLQSNLLRYLALGALIIMGMYMIVSMVGAAETVIRGVDLSADQHQLEDGQFHVFVPLTDAEKQKITDRGVTLEDAFYLDYQLEDQSTVRAYRNRADIDRLVIDQGKEACTESEVVLEKRYASEHNYQLQDQIRIGNDTFTIVGICSVPDYDSVLKEFSDSSVDSNNFGLVFFTDSGYQKLKSERISMKSEEFVYTYRLNGKMSDDDLKDLVKEFQFSNEDVDDIYFQEYWDRTAGKKQEIKDNLSLLNQGSEDLSNGLGELTDQNEQIKEGALQIFQANLDQAGQNLSTFGVTEKLTTDNYQTIFQQLIETTDQPLVKMQLKSSLSQLNSLNQYVQGVTAYTDGVEQSGEGAQGLHDGIGEFREATDEFLDQAFQNDASNLTQFLVANDNPRIKASSDDQVINKYAGLIAGVIVMILFTYVISVFVIHGIEKESSVIGALYALGVKKTDLIMHYLTLPFIVTTVAGIIGTVIGFSSFGINTQMGDVYDYFSVPVLHTVYPVYLLLYGIIMPPLVSAVVNYLVIRKKLSQPALTLIRNEKKMNHISNVNLGDMKFISRFRIRQMLREMRTSFTVLFGMFISLLILMMGIDCYVLCNHISVNNKKDTRYEYMYTYKYPESIVPDGGEAAYVKTFTKKAYGYEQQITMMGIDQNNPYFDAEVSDGKNEVIISSAMAQKFNLKKNDQIILTDKEENMEYAFSIKDITNYSVGLYCFMDINSMRERFGVDDDYYNVVLSDHDLNLDQGRLYAITSKADISISSDVFVQHMKPMVIMLICVSGLIFCVVMYLMMKVMIDRSAFGISLIKIFGYRKNEVKKLYLSGNLYLIAVGAAVLIPVTKYIMDQMYPILISNVSCGMDLTFTWQIYLILYLVIVGLYLIINQFLVRKLNQTTPAEILKNRE